MNRNYYHHDQHQMLYNGGGATSYQMPSSASGAQVPINSLTNDLMSPQSSVTSTSFLAAANTIVLGTSTSPSSYPTPPSHMMGSVSNHNDTLIRRLKQQQLDQSDMLDFELHVADSGGGGGGGGEKTAAAAEGEDEPLPTGPIKQALNIP